jgi:hypothetical protein
MGFLPYEIAEALTLTDVREITDPLALLRINIGLAWESHYIPNILSHYGVVDHPGEMEFDGVYMTHDGEDLSVVFTPEVKGYKVRVHEVKATYKSTATVGDMVSQWMWLAQLKSYCKAKDTDVALMHILYLCGNYKFPIQPLREVREITFTKRELDDNWSLLRQYRDERLLAELDREEIDGTPHTSTQ